MFKKLKSLILDDTIYMAILLVLTAITSFGLGRMSVITNKTESPQAVQAIAPLVKTVETTPQTATVLMASTTISDNTNQTAQNFVASKSGTKYHAPHCPGAKQIKETNKIFFVSENEAEAAGYTRAANCKF